MTNKNKAYLININTFYLNLYDFKSPWDFSCWLYQFLDAYGRDEYYKDNTKYLLLKVRMHNDEIDISKIYMYPFMDRSIGFEDTYIVSMRSDNTRFIIVEVKIMDELEYIN